MIPCRSVRVARPPVIQRIHIEVLPIQVDRLLREQAVDVVREPLPGLRGSPD